MKSSHALVVWGVVLITAALAAGTLVDTTSYHSLLTDRDSSLGVAADTDGVLGIDKTTDLDTNTVMRLVTVTNNFGAPATITVSLDTTAGADLYIGGTNVGDSYTTTVATGGSQQFDVEVTDGSLAQVQFDVTGASNASSAEVLDRVVNVKSNVDSAFSYTCDGATQTCDFDASASTTSQGNLVQYSWDFGDGASGTGQTITHTYASTGTYTVSLTVQNNHGATDTETKTVTVDSTLKPPIADFTSSRSGNSQNVELDGTASSDPDGTIVSYEWDVGDDGTIDGTGATVKLKAQPGTQVTLIVTDNDGQTDTVTKTVN